MIVETTEPAKSFIELEGTAVFQSMWFTQMCPRRHITAELAAKYWCRPSHEYYLHLTYGRTRFYPYSNGYETSSLCFRDSILDVMFWVIFSLHLVVVMNWLVTFSIWITPSKTWVIYLPSMGLEANDQCAYKIWCHSKCSEYSCNGCGFTQMCLGRHMRCRPPRQLRRFPRFSRRDVATVYCPKEPTFYKINWWVRSQYPNSQ